jgi:hypothetical protein
MRKQFICSHAAYETVWKRLKFETRYRIHVIDMDRPNPEDPPLALMMFNRTTDRIEVGKMIEAEERFLATVGDEKDEPSLGPADLIRRGS